MTLWWRTLLLLACAMVAQCYPTCYTKVLSMGREITDRDAEIKRNPVTARCTAHLPDLYVDVHNACIMPRMRTYILSLENLRDRHCARNKVVQKQTATVRQMHLIMAHKCHGDLHFSKDDCAALDYNRRAT